MTVSYYKDEAKKRINNIGWAKLNCRNGQRALSKSTFFFSSKARDRFQVISWLLVTTRRKRRRLPLGPVRFGPDYRASESYSRELRQVAAAQDHGLLRSPPRRGGSSY